MADAVARSGPNGRTLTASRPTRLLTADDLADRWQVRPAHVYRLAREGRLPTVNIGRYRRFALAAIEDFEAAGGSQTVA